MDQSGTAPPARQPGRPWATIFPLILGSLPIIAWLIISAMSRYYASQLEPAPSSLFGALWMQRMLSPVILLLLLILLFIPPRSALKFCLLLPMCPVIVMLMVVSPLAGQRDKVWSATFHRVIRHSQPLLTAISDYQQDNGSPPPALDALVPRYLAAVPGTGIKAFPAYHYTVNGNAWSLTIHCPYGVVDFSYYRYCSSSEALKVELANYDLEEHVGNWVYVRD
ncbi:MAG: hypothetical protein ACYDCO_11110 [Armatimonadota bacterium]